MVHIMQRFKAGDRMCCLIDGSYKWGEFLKLETKQTFWFKTDMDKKTKLVNYKLIDWDIYQK